MKVVIVNNKYQQAGGEEVVVRNEIAMLSSHGHEVEMVQVSNSRINSTWRRIKTAWQATYSYGSLTMLREKLKEKRPSIVHVHNFFPLLSPSIYDACREVGIPVVQTLHNYRIICPGALLLRNDRKCERCIDASPFVAVAHRCYRDSWLGTLAVARMVEHHRRRGTWQDKVDRFIAITEFAKGKFVAAGIPADKIAVKPNFVTPDPGIGRSDGDYVLFVGRLSPEKGISLLLKVWAKLGSKIQLKIVGFGPLEDEVKRASKRLQGIQYLGHRRKEEVISLMKQACVLVYPSLCYETLPLAVIEAFAVGLPVVGSRSGSLAELIQSGKTGLHFQPNDPEDLQEKLEWLLSNSIERSRMRESAREEYLEKYTEQSNYTLLMEIYQQAMVGAGDPDKK